MKPAVTHPARRAVAEHFYQITRNRAPRAREAAVRQHVIDLADQAGHQWRCDAAGNLAVAVPATAGTGTARWW